MQPHPLLWEEEEAWESAVGDGAAVRMVPGTVQQREYPDRNETGLRDNCYWQEMQDNIFQDVMKPIAIS